MRLLLATRNAKKLAELQRILFRHFDASRGGNSLRDLAERHFVEGSWIIDEPPAGQRI